MYTRNMTTRHAELFGGTNGYLVTEDEEFARLRAFAADLRLDRN
jgi:hypothetical protein